MEVEFKDNPELEDNPELDESVEETNELREFIVQYVGSTLEPEKNEVTVGMIVEVFAEQFPEFLMAVAEENWIRGYHQALSDAEEGEKLLKEHNENQENVDDNND